MPEKVKIVCIACPRGCRAELLVEGAEVLEVEGIQCKRGRDYVAQEFRNPVRVLTTTVRIEGGGYLPVRTRGAVPKDRILEIAAALRKVVARPPVAVGDVIYPNILETGVDVVATSARDEDTMRRAS